MEKACIILGAGASHDVYNGGSPLINVDFKPPLARDLFDMEQHPTYWQVMQQYPRARVLTQLLSPKARKNEFSLEQELRTLANHSDPQVAAHFKQIPPYLRDLLLKASYEYTHMPGCHFQILYELLSEQPHQLLFLVLNYDNLLEKALVQFHPGQYKFESIDDYIRAERQAKVVKIHGSIDWFKLIGSPHRASWDDTVQATDVLKKPPDNEIYIRTDLNLVRGINIDQNMVYPLITAPLAGKGVDEMVCPTRHIEVARDFLKDCKKFLIVGTSGLDEDLLSFLNSAVRNAVNWGRIHVVGGTEQDAKTTFERFQAGVTAFRGVPAKPGLNAHGIGLRPYVSEGQLQIFSRTKAT